MSWRRELVRRACMSTVQSLPHSCSPYRNFSMSCTPDCAPDHHFGSLKVCELDCALLDPAGESFSTASADSSQLARRRSGAAPQPLSHCTSHARACASAASSLANSGSCAVHVHQYPPLYSFEENTYHNTMLSEIKELSACSIAAVSTCTGVRKVKLFMRRRLSGA